MQIQVYGLQVEFRHAAERPPKTPAHVKAEFPGLPILMRPDMTRSRTVGFYWMEKGEVRWSGPHGAPAVRDASQAAAFA